MPTYLNSNDFPIAVDGIHFNAQEKHSTRRILNDPRLTFVSNTPYYNPTVAIQEAIATGAGDMTINLDARTREVKIWKVAGSEVIVYLQDKNAGKFVELPPDYGSDVKINIGHGLNCNQLILTFSGEGSCEIMEMIG